MISKNRLNFISLTNKFLNLCKILEQESKNSSRTSLNEIFRINIYLKGKFLKTGMHKYSRIATMKYFNKKRIFILDCVSHLPNNGSRFFVIQMLKQIDRISEMIAISKVTTCSPNYLTNINGIDQIRLNYQPFGQIYSISQLQRKTRHIHASVQVGIANHT